MPTRARCEPPRPCTAPRSTSSTIGRRSTRFGALLGASDRLRLLDPALHRELVGELRWTHAAATTTGDGIEVASLGLDRSGVAALRLLTRPAVAAFLAEHDLGGRLTEVQRPSVSATSALALVAVDGDTPADRVRGGRAVQRMWLEATARRLAVQPVTPLTLFGPSKERDAWLAALFDVGDAAPILILRLHRGSGVPPGARLPAPCPRRPAHRGDDMTTDLAITRQLLVRRARSAAEVDAVLLGRHRVYSEDHDFFEPTADGRIHDRFDTYPDTTVHLVAELDGGIVGGVRYCIDDGGVGLPVDEVFDFSAHVRPRDLLVVRQHAVRRSATPSGVGSRPG